MVHFEVYLKEQTYIGTLRKNKTILGPGSEALLGSAGLCLCCFLSLCVILLLLVAGIGFPRWFAFCLSVTRWGSTRRVLATSVPAKVDRGKGGVCGSAKRPHEVFSGN